MSMEEIRAKVRSAYESRNLPHLLELVDGLKIKLILKTAEAEGAVSLLLEVQQDCITANKRVKELEIQKDAATVNLDWFENRVGELESELEWSGYGDDL